MAQQGYNTFHGFDNGPPPPGMNPSQPQGMAQYPQIQAGLYAQPASYGFPGLSQQVAYPQPYVQPQYGYPNATMTHPSQAPRTNIGFPGTSLKNPTGGFGLPPGYDYLFPSEHCAVHAFTTGNDKPWQVQAPQARLLPHVKVFVSTSMTVKEMMTQLGCNNSDAGKNVLYEVTEKGNGEWAKGITIRGDEKDKVKKKISEFCWNASRDGIRKPPVWLYLTKD